MLDSPFLRHSLWVNNAVTDVNKMNPIIKRIFFTTNTSSYIVSKQQMTYIPPEDIDNLIKYIPDGIQHVILSTSIPWSAHHDGTVVLGRSYNGHVFLKINCHRNPELYYIGDARGLCPPIFLKDFSKKKEVVHIDMSMAQLVIIAMRRIQNQLIEKEIPEVSTIENEHMAQKLIKYIASVDNNLNGWIHMEQCRIKSLLEHYDFDNIKIIYPMLKNKALWSEEIVLGYAKLNTITIPDMDIFKWVHDVINNF